MPTKRELLEEKTVKELKQMARDKDLSGYSSMNKSELVDLVKSNYLKDEIETWPNLDLGEVGWGGRSEEKEKEPREVPTEEIEVDRIWGMRRDVVYIALVLGATAAIIVMIILVYFSI